MAQRVALHEVRRLRLAPICTVLLALSGFAPTLVAQRVAAPGPVKDVEQWLTTVPVSGGIRVGFMAFAPSADFDPDSFTVFLPAERARFLCVELSSQDGRYSARLERELHDARSGPLVVSRRSDYRAQLDTYPATKVAILAQLGDDCARPAGPYVLASWHAGSRRDTVTVFLNSRVPTYIAGGPNRLVHEVRCTNLDGVTTAYNLRCDVPSAWITGENRFYVRMRRGPSFSQVALPLRLPP